MKLNFLKKCNIFARINQSLKFRLEKKLFLEQWFLIFDFEKDIGIKSPRTFNKIIPPKDRLWADPFIVFKDMKYYIFFEEFIFIKNKAHISYFIINKDGSYTNSKKILEESFHLSYPCIFEYNDELYMIPETQEIKSIQLYKCLEFPEKWVFHKNMISNIDAVDSTIFFYKNKWWMFTSIREKQENSWSNLHIFHADNPTGTWIPHSKNPIKNNISNSRSAGAIFVENDKMYRPAQISSTKEYGMEIAINEIIFLNEEKYEEVTVKIIKPWDKGIKGIHTVNHENDLTVYDAKWKIKR